MRHFVFFALMIKVSTWLHAEKALEDLYETPVWHPSQASGLTAALPCGVQSVRSEGGG